MCLSKSMLAYVAVLAWLLFQAQSTPVPRGRSSSFRWDETKYVIAFGDSYTYAQGTLGYANSTFIGSRLNLSYTPAQLLADRIVQEDVDGTANRGPNWVERLTGCGVAAGLTDPRACAVQLWDFAFGGADVSADYLPPHHPWSVQLVDQAEQFLRYARPALRGVVDPRRALVAVWIGINDVGDSDALPVDFPGFYDELVATVFERVVAPVYGAGYRSWLFMKLPPLDRTPGNVARAAGPLPNETMVGWWDDALDRHAAAFAARNEDATALVFDSNAFLNRVLDHPAEYNITNTTSYCAQYDQPLPVTQYGCLPLEEYFWYNNGHMSTHVHKILSEEVERFLRNSSGGA